MSACGSKTVQSGYHNNDSTCARQFLALVAEQIGKKKRPAKEQAEYWEAFCNGVKAEEIALKQQIQRLSLDA